jgi:anti-sigma regulatory factor (Ser/Thr protein kinase)
MEVTAYAPMMIQVSEPSHTGEARRRAIEYAEKLGFNQTESGAVAIAVTEMATNLIKHAQQGKIFLQALPLDGRTALRITSMDQGPGMRDLALSFQDGQSTTRTSGTGLGAMRRLSHRFEVYSNPGLGTFILAEFWSGKKKPRSSHLLHAGVVCVPIKGETASGDGWGIRELAESTLFMVVDGLGHGTHAAEAAREAERILSISQDASPQAVIERAHDALRKTRGAAMSVASVNQERGTLTFAGIGNVTGYIVSPHTSRGMASYNGIVGHQYQKLQEFKFAWQPDSILVMHSDGLSGRWDLNKYPGIWAQDPALIAAVLYTNFAREQDDATVLVAKNS